MDKRQLRIGDTFEVAEHSTMVHYNAGDRVVIVFVEPETYVGDVIYKVAGNDGYGEIEWADAEQDINVDTIELANGKGQYLVFCPDTDKVPSRWYFTHDQAKLVARKMTEEHNKTFYVLRATEKYTTGGVTKEVL